MGWVFPTKKVENWGNFPDGLLLFAFVVTLSPFSFILHIFKGIIWHETFKHLTMVATSAESFAHRQLLSHEHSKVHVPHCYKHSWNKINRKRFLGHSFSTIRRCQRIYLEFLLPPFHSTLPSFAPGTYAPSTCASQKLHLELGRQLRW